MKAIGLGIVICALLASGCSKPSDTKPSGAAAPESKNAKSDDEHVHGAGPNGGVVFDLGSYHAEFTVDHGKQECTVLVLGEDEKTPTAVAATEFVLIIKETKTADGKVVAPMTITMSPADATNGKATKFVGSDPGFGNVAEFAGTVSGEIDGKPAMGEFKE